MLSARRRFAAVGAGLVAENGLRCLGALALWLAGVDDPGGVRPRACSPGTLAAAALAVGASGSARTGTGGDGESAAGASSAATGGPSCSARRSLTGGPVLLALAGGTAPR